MKKRYLLIIFCLMNINQIVFVSDRNESFGIKEMERVVRHTAFVVSLPKRSSDKTHANFKKSRIQYDAEAGKVFISNKANMQKKDPSNPKEFFVIKDFVGEVRSHLNNRKDRYEVGGFIYKKRANGSIVGFKKYDS